MTRTAVRRIAAAGVGCALLVTATTLWAQSAPEPERSDVVKMEPPKPDWFFVDGGWNMPGTSIFDGDTGKMKGMVETRRLADFAMDPSGKYYYVSETIWSKGDRGTRQDMVSVYDTVDLKLQAEIAIPGRILIGSRKNNFIVSGDGKFAYIYNFNPTSLVNVVDLSRRKFVAEIELPGCASLMPNPGVGFSALCSDGTIATVAVNGTKSAITHGDPFFSATDDPIFDNFTYDKAKNQTVFLSYTGLIYTATLGPNPTVSKPFSIQAAAGIRPGETKPLELNWYPGGRQPMALHRPSGHLFVLMHMGEYWSHKASGSEVWEIDLGTQKVVKRHVLEEPMNNIEVSQSARPLLFLNGEEGTAVVIDTASWEQKHKIEQAGAGTITAAGAS